MVAMVIVSFFNMLVLSAFSTNDLLSDVSAGFDFCSSSIVDFFFFPCLDFPFLSFNTFSSIASLWLFLHLNLKHSYQPSFVLIGVLLVEA